MQHRIIFALENTIRKERVGFLKWRSCIDHIFTLWQISEQAREWNSTVHASLIDSEKVFHLSTEKRYNAS